jgi:4-diphosphocytidyl-2-C-methyl-D-erythritol kinase
VERSREQRFEEIIFKDYPEIKSIKELFYREGAVYASMSGSGSAVYGLFREEPKFESNYLQFRVKLQ